METDLNEFEADRRIDPSALDVECIRQADLFFKWAERSVEAKSDVDRLRLVKDVVEARLQAEVRRKPAKYRIEGRVTEAAVKAAVLKHPKFVKAHDDYLEARETSALLDSAVTALEMKKRMLESLITLHGQNYFAGPSTPRDLVKAWNKSQGATDEQKAKLRKRNKS